MTANRPQAANVIFDASLSRVRTFTQHIVSIVNDVNKSKVVVGKQLLPLEDILVQVSFIAKMIVSISSLLSHCSH